MVSARAGHVGCAARTPKHTRTQNSHARAPTSGFENCLQRTDEPLFLQPIFLRRLCLQFGRITSEITSQKQNFHGVNAEYDEHFNSIAS